MPETAAPSAAPAGEESSAAPTPERSASASWIDHLLGRDVAPEEPADTQPPSTSDARTYTQSELQNLVEAEIARRDGERLTAAQQAERRRLRDEDPFLYAEADRLAEQREQASAAYGSQIATVAQSLDRALLDPLIELVDERDRPELFKADGAGVGVEGRKMLATAALDKLKEKWRAEGAQEALEGRWRPRGQRQSRERPRGTAPRAGERPNGMAISNFFRRQIGVYTGPE